VAVPHWTSIRDGLVYRVSVKEPAVLICTSWFSSAALGKLWGGQNSRTPARIITKLFRHTNVRIAYTTNNSLRKLLNPRQEDQHTDVYNLSGVYQLTCNACQKRYIGQIDRPFRTRFKEHQQDCKHNGEKSLYAKHLMEHNHPFHPIENSVHILHTANKGRLLNAIENIYIHRETTANNQLNENMTIKPNIIFDVILRH
jgi:hypothetical protein